MSRPEHSQLEGCHFPSLRESVALIEYTALDRTGWSEDVEVILENPIDASFGSMPISANGIGPLLSAPNAFPPHVLRNDGSSVELTIPPACTLYDERNFVYIFRHSSELAAGGSSP